MQSLKRRPSSYSCPKHPQTKLEKKYLDAYFCPICRYDWLIHAYRHEKDFAHLTRECAYSCPRHPEKGLGQIRIDVYYCAKCDHDWLIKCKTLRAIYDDDMRD